MIQKPLLDAGGTGSPKGGAGSCTSAAAKAKACGASALEQVAAGESDGGVKYKRRIVRDRDGNLVVRIELDLGFGRVTANDHLRQLWHEQLTDKNNKLALAALENIDARGHARLAARIGAKVRDGSSEPSPADGESQKESSLPSAVASAVLGGRIDI